MSETKPKTPRKQLTAREKAAKALADYNKYIVEAEAEGIVDVVKTTNIVAEYNKMRKIIVPIDRKSTRLNSSHLKLSRMPSSA